MVALKMCLIPMIQAFPCLLLGTIFLLSACSTSDRPESPAPLRASPTAQEQQPSGARAEDYVLGPRNYLGHSRASIIAQLGPPTRQSFRRVQNLHDPQQTDFIHTLEYDGLQVTTYEVPAFGKEFLFSVDVSRDYPSITSGLSFGMTEAQLIEKAGLPSARQPSVLEYTPSGEESDKAVLEARFASGRLVRLTWSFFLD